MRGAADATDGPLGALRLDSVTRRFAEGQRPAVDGVSFEVGAGELLALVGASGSGKTTTLRMIAGYERPDGGSITLTAADGAVRDITRESPQRRGFGMVFQHYALFPHMNVERNVAFGLEARGVPKRNRLERARAALTNVGLAHVSGRPVQSLSGGEQQRVAVARALVIEPPVLLLDEPLSNLDPALRQGTREQLRSMLRALHVTAVFVTHDQEDAFAIADRIAMLHQGRLLQTGTPEELYRSPTSAHVARFIGRSTLVPAVRDGNSAAITLGGVTQRAPLAGAPTGSDLRAVLRPEMLTLTAPAPDVWPGAVRSRRFAGNHFVYQVAFEAPSAADALLIEVADAPGAFAERDKVGLKLGDRRVALVTE